MRMAASAATVTDTVVVPEVPNVWARADGVISKAPITIIKKSFFILVSPYVALIVNVSEAAKLLVVNWGSLAKTKLTGTELGSGALHAPPPPVHTPAGMVSTGVCSVVLTVCVPEQEVPSDAPPQVYVSAPVETDGPPGGEKSEVA